MVEGSRNRRYRRLDPTLIIATAETLAQPPAPGGS